MERRGKVRYIKLGQGGRWFSECERGGVLRLGSRRRRRRGGGDARSPWGPEGEDAVVGHGVRPGRGHEGGEPLDQRLRGEQERGGAVVPRGLRGQRDEAVGSGMEAMGAEGGAGDVATQAFQPLSVDGVSSVLVLVGTYDLTCRHENGENVPQNMNFPILVGQENQSDTTLATDLVSREVRLRATLNGAEFPDEAVGTGNV